MPYHLINISSLEFLKLRYIWQLNTITCLKLQPSSCFDVFQNDFCLVKNSKYVTLECLLLGEYIDIYMVLGFCNGNANMARIPNAASTMATSIYQLDQRLRETGTFIPNYCKVVDLKSVEKNKYYNMLYIKIRRPALNK